MLVRLSALSSLVLPLSLAFSTTYGTPSECDDLEVTWTGGTAPFSLLIIPVFGTPRNISIPPTAFVDGKGSFSTPIPLKKDEEVVLTMSDATSFNAGGSSTVLKVEESKGGACNTTDPGVAFAFQLNTALQQCRDFTFNAYDQAVQPVTIGAVIPGGDAFLIVPPTGPTRFNWLANVARGTSMVFFMTDSQGRQGGSSDVRLVGSSDDAACLGPDSPSSTTSMSPTSTSLPPTQSSAPPASGVKDTKDSFGLGAIAGTVIGGLLFLAVVITLGLFFLKKMRNGSGGGHAKPYRKSGHGVDSEVDLTYHGNQQFGSHSQTPYTPNPNLPPSPYLDNPSGSQYTSPSSQHLAPMTNSSSAYAASQYSSSQYTQYEQQPQYGVYPQVQSQTYPPYPRSEGYAAGSELDHHANGATNTHQRGPSTSAETTLTAAQRKAMLAGATAQPQQPARFILHTDAEDELPAPNADGVFELPPQYTERRGQAPARP